MNFLRYSTLRIIILTKVYESVFFQLKTLVKVTVENVSDVVWRSSRYLKASPNIALRVFKKNDGRTTRRSRDMQLKVKKNEFFKVFNSQNILTKVYVLKVTLENFSDVVWRCPRYRKAFPNIALRVREKMTVVRRVDQEICN